MTIDYYICTYELQKQLKSPADLPTIDEIIENLDWFMYGDKTYATAEEAAAALPDPQQKVHTENGNTVLRISMSTVEYSKQEEYIDRYGIPQTRETECGIAIAPESLPQVILNGKTYRYLPGEGRGSFREPDLWEEC